MTCSKGTLGFEPGWTVYVQSIAYVVCVLTTLAPERAIDIIFGQPNISPLEISGH